MGDVREEFACAQFADLHRLVLPSVITPISRGWGAPSRFRAAFKHNNTQQCRFIFANILVSFECFIVLLIFDGSN